MKIDVILPAKFIPNGSSVTKKAGQKIYAICDKLPIYSEKQIISPNIKIDCDLRVLNDGTSITLISGETELIWKTDTIQLYDFMERLE